MVRDDHATINKRLALLSLIATIVVVAIKLLAARLSGSVSVLSEGLQSLVDVGMSGLAVYAVALAAKPPDKDHPYGHGKAEVLVGAIQMMTIMATAAMIVWMAIQRFSNPQAIQWDVGALAMVYAAVSNTAVSLVLMRGAEKSGSVSLKSEALHLRGDTYMSLGILAGLLLVGATNLTWLDPVFAILTAVVGVGIALKHLVKLSHALMDGALPPDQVHLVERVLEEHPSAMSYHNLRTRAVGSDRFVDLHVLLRDDLTFVGAHEEAERIEDELRAVLGGAIVTIHYEPYEAETKHRAEAHSNE